MKAITIEETGGPEVLRLVDLDTPEPGPGEILIRVAAAGVNYTDVMARQGIYLTREAAMTFPATLGTEVAGTVVAVGAGVGHAIGARVVALVDGGYAEYAIAPADLTYELPVAVDFATAVGYLVQGASAWHMLNDCARLRAGETVLVHSGAGGVGTLAIQLAAALGASTVIATAGSARKLRLAEELGADVCIDYTRPDWAQRVQEATAERGADVILDAVGGDITEQSLTCLAAYGRLVVYGVSNKRLASFAGSQLMHKNQTVSGYWLRSRLSDDPRSADAIREILALAEAGKIRVVVHDVFALDQAADAHRAISDRRTMGKVVLLP